MNSTGLYNTGILFSKFSVSLDMFTAIVQFTPPTLKKCGMHDGSRRRPGHDTTTIRNQYDALGASNSNLHTTTQ